MADEELKEIGEKYLVVRGQISGANHVFDKLAFVRSQVALSDQGSSPHAAGKERRDYESRPYHKQRTSGHANAGQDARPVEKLLTRFNEVPDHACGPSHVFGDLLEPSGHFDFSCPREHAPRLGWLTGHLPICTRVSTHQLGGRDCRSFGGPATKVEQTVQHLPRPSGAPVALF